MGGLQRHHETIQEFAAARRGIGKQPVHLRREPDGGKCGGDFRLRPGPRAVQLENTALQTRIGIST
jgi:hypothetical protein